MPGVLLKCKHVRGVELLKDQGNNAQLLRVGTKEFNKMLTTKWAAMSAEEKHNYTHDKVAELEKRRGDRAVGVRNTELAAFHDVRSTVASLHDEVSVPALSCCRSLTSM